MKRFLLVASFLGLMFTAPVLAQDGKNPRVVLDTSAGKITVELFADKAPATVKNFLQYVEDKHYDGTIFHRVIPDFMIQGGGFQPGMTEKRTRDPIKNEAGNGLSNEAGTLAMARTSDPNSATAQFFINVANNGKGLDRKAGSAGYAVFGKVVEGMDIVNNIRKVRTQTKGNHDDVPVDDVVIKTARRVK